MKAVIQRVAQARVEIAGSVVGEIGAGLLVLLCAERGDTEAHADRMLTKILKLRIFQDRPGDGMGQAEGTARSGKMNLSVQDVSGALLVVSQFTLAADLSGGNRPGFSGAAAPDDGLRLYEYFVGAARRTHAQVQTGRFGADMQVHLINDGPVTIPVHIA